MRCDRCGRTRDDVRIFAAQGDRIRTREGEDRLRDYLETLTGEHIGGFPKLCGDCDRDIDWPRILSGKSR